MVQMVCHAALVLYVHSSVPPRVGRPSNAPPHLGSPVRLLGVAGAAASKRPPFPTRFPCPFPKGTPAGRISRDDRFPYEIFRELPCVVDHVSRGTLSRRGRFSRTKNRRELTWWLPTLDQNLFLRTCPCLCVDMKEHGVLRS